MKLYFAPGSPFSRIIRVLLRELDIACEEIELVEFPPSPAFFAVNPLGQVPTLLMADGFRFPTRIIVDELMTMPRKNNKPVAPAVRRDADNWQDDQLLAVLLAMGDAIAALKYQAWAGLGPTGENLIGYDPAARHTERVERTLDWLEQQATPDGFQPGVLSVQDISLACLLLWTEARGGFPWRGRTRLEVIVEKCAIRPSFAATKPQPWP